ncbi:toll/interleukin-1 receptor domain-containing protein [Streptosporangium sp. CA-135522]|uniref:toll/interleukin-1 receptor domain-containing protein n=1 Tax=Streptosporangium sp. CA-135522 TaxID=3240072 RepID=UPI003D8FB31C
MTTRTRIAIVVSPYVTAVWVMFFAGMSGDDERGVIAFLLVEAGLLVLVQSTWMRGRFSVASVFTWNLVVLMASGLAAGTMSRGETPQGVVGGFVIGVLAGLASLWLGDLAQLRHRPRVFLSYRRGDSSDVTADLYQLLAGRYGRRNVFMDVHSIRPGRDFRRELDEVIKRCDVLVAVIGPQWLDIRDEHGRRRVDQPEDYVRIEIETALSARLPVVPVLVCGAVLPRRENLPQSLADLPYMQGASLRPPPDFREDFHTLVTRFEETLQLHASGTITPPPPKPGPRRRLKVAVLVLALLIPPAWKTLDVVTADVRNLNDAALSPDGTRIASVHGTGLGVNTTLRLWNAGTGRLEAIGDYPADMGPMWTVRWSPDGRLLATGDHEGTIRIWDATSLTVIRTLRGHQGMLDDLAWSPKGEEVASGDEKGTVRVWNVGTGELVASTTLFSQRVSALVWSPRGREIAAGSWDTTVVVAKVEGRGLKRLRTLTEHTSFIKKLAWSPDGRRLASGALQPPYLAVHDLEDGTAARVMILERQPDVVTALRWSPDGAWLASASGDDVRLWDAGGGLRRRLSLGQAYDPDLAWAPDSSAVASADDSAVRIWPVKEGEPAAQPAGRRGTSAFAGWSPDGRRVVSWTRYGDEVRVWDVGSRTDIAICRLSVWDGLLSLF